jgi:hypothetical protein
MSKPLRRLVGVTTSTVGGNSANYVPLTVHADAWGACERLWDIDCAGSGGDENRWSRVTSFYAEDYHQQYLAKNQEGYSGNGGCGVKYSHAV